MSAPSIPSYSISHQLGQGGVASIWKATGPEGQPCVLKVLHPHLVGEPALHGILRREAQLLRQLQHPHIRQLRRWGRAPCGTPYLELEYLDGVAWSALLQRVRGTLKEHIPLGIACATMAEISLALDFAHDAVPGLIHRDVSPPNILLTYKGLASLIDFGVAEADGLPLPLELAGADVVQGKAAYMSPEQCRGESLDRRSDIFCLGIALWESLAGRRLFRGADDTASMALILAGEHEAYPRPSMHRKGIPKALEDACMKALAYHREDRFADGQAFHDALQAAKATLGVTMERGLFVEYVFGASSVGGV